MKRNLLKVAAFLFAAVVSVSAMAQTVTLQEPVQEPADTYKRKGDYQLVNQWIRSTTAGNYTKNDLGGSGLVRGMVAKDGKMYFCYRNTSGGAHSIIVVDGVTGAYEKTIILSENAFTKVENEGTDSANTVSAVLLPNNDIKLDSEGNFLVGPIVTSANQPMMIYKVDIETGECTELINEVIAENPEYAELNIRLDAFGVWGDVEDYAVVMAMNDKAMNCFRWFIEDGVAGAAELVTLDPLFEGDASVNPGSAPQIMPISEDLFYVDGNATFPTLYQYADGKGTRIECFYDAEGNALPILNTMNQGHNGITDFALLNADGEIENFMCCAATNTIKAPNSSFAIIKYADESLSFQTAELIYQFPSEGFGGTSNGYRTAPVSVEVIDNVAHLYCYVGENGFGHYVFSCDGENISPTNQVNIEYNKSHGYVSGAGEYISGSEAILTATPKEGYHFVRWSDGNTNATRTITVTENITLTAEFAINTYNVIFSAENGLVEGSGIYEYGTAMTLTAIPNEGYHFVSWSDGNTNATRTITITSDISLSAEFEINVYDVTLTAENGTVIGSAKYAHGANATIMVIPNEGYKFDRWSDGNTDNPRTIVVTQNVILHAVCLNVIYNVTLTAENGTFIGAGEYGHGTEATITAVPNEGYHFVRWSDGNINATRTITVTSHISLSAEFEINVYDVTLIAENGSVVGAGKYSHGSEITIIATPDEGYHFVRWSDGNTSATRTIIVTSNITLSAEFKINIYDVILTAENGTVFGAGKYSHNSSITFAVVAHEGYKFTNWSDGNTENPRTMIVTENVNFEAILDIDLPNVEKYNNFMVESANEEEGIVTIFISAEGITGFQFSHWSDGNTENPRIVTLDEDIELYAYFMPLISVDNETSKIKSANVYTNDGNLYVEGVNTNYYVLDVAGRLIYSGRKSILPLPSGVYMIVVGDEVEKIVL